MRRDQSVEEWKRRWRPIRKPSFLPNWEARVRRYGRCPRCNLPLAERINKGKGTMFLGCEGYPRCKYTRALSKEGPGR